MAKKRKIKKAEVTHFDEQTEGALMQAIKTMKPYTQIGTIITLTNDGTWKILAFGDNYDKESFEKILFECLNAGAMSYMDNKGNITNWEI